MFMEKYEGIGKALKKASDTTKLVLSNISDALSTAIRWVINCAPFGIMGLVYTTVSTTGLAAFGSYLRIIAVLVGCMFFVALVVNPIMVFVCIRRNPYPLVFKCLRDSGIMAFFTRSSAANIPVNMSLCEELGLDEDKYSVSIPLGATINMAGAAITITVLTLAAAHTMGVEVDFVTAVLLSLVSTVSACGASGVAGGSLLLIPLACSLFGISNDVAMQVVGTCFIIGVIQDSCETALNSSSDVLLLPRQSSISAERQPKRAGKRKKKLRRQLLFVVRSVGSGGEPGGFGGGVPQVPGLAVNFCCGIPVADHADLLGRIMLCQIVHNSFEGHRGGQRNGIAVNSGGDGGKIHTLDPVGCGQFQTGAVAGGQQRGFVPAAAVPDGAGGVDDIPGGQIVALGQLGLPRFAATQRAAFRQQFRSRGAMDGAVHTAASQQGGVGGVDDSFCRGLCDIPCDDGESVHKITSLSV